MHEVPYIFNYESLGKGDAPLIMLHGFGESLESLKPLAELLSENRHVLLIDLPGFGKSPYDESLTSARAIAIALSTFLKVQGIKQADFLGHSFGGKVGMTFASCYPKFVRKLILIASSGLKRKRGLKDAIRHQGVKTLGKFVKAADKAFGSELFPTWFTGKFASSDYKHFPHVRKILIRSINENIDGDIARIKNPALILWGALDTETPLEMGERLNGMIEGSKIIVYPTLGHKPFKDVGRHLIKEHVDRFLC